MLTGYNLDEVSKFSLLQSKLGGNALAMVESLDLVYQSYAEARTLLLDTFELVTPVQFNAVEQMVKIKMRNNNSIGFFADFRKVMVRFKNLKVDLEVVMQYFLWSGMTTEMQEALVQVTGETYPDLNQILDKYKIASHRFEAMKSKNPKKDKINTSANAMSINQAQTANAKSKNNNINKSRPKQKAGPPSKGKGGPFCKFCKSESHAPWDCKKFISPKDRIDELNRLGHCVKCAGASHTADNCKTNYHKECKSCGQKGHFTWLCKNKTQSGAFSSPPPPPSSGAKGSPGLVED